MKKTAQWLIGITLIGIVIGAYWFQPPFLHRLELLFQNAHFLWRGPIVAGSEVVIAAVDEKSLDELGRWPWPRTTVSRLVEKLVEHDVKVIGFDMVFSSPEDSIQSHELEKLKQDLLNDPSRAHDIQAALDRFIQQSNHDEQFASILRQSRRAVLGYFFHFNARDVEHLDSLELQSHLDNIKPSQYSAFIRANPEVDLSAIPFPEIYAVESNVSALSKKVRRAGYFNFFSEPDGSQRKLPLIVKAQDPITKRDHFFPPLSVRILEKFVGGSLMFRINDFGIEEVVLNGEEPIVIPTNEKGDFYINYLGKRGRFPYVSITDILRDRKDKIPPGFLKDKIILVGATAPAMEDLRVTPFDSVFPGVEVQATIINNILHQNFIYQPNWIVILDALVLLGLGLFLILLYSRIQPFWGAGVWGLVSIFLFFFNNWVFVHKHVFLSNIFPQIENMFLFFGLILYRHFTEEKEKQFIKTVFGKYLSPQVINQIIKDPGKLKLGGEEKEMTALFTDLASFTTISEQLTPTQLVEMLNEFFTEMTQILIRHGGTLDKYDGDAIKAFFGAPVHFPDHAKRACFVSIEMQDRLKELRELWKNQGRPQLKMRVGLNTGRMVVGNLGSKYRMDYGMNGDSVNLAARLESVNKVFGTETIISESTYEQARDFISVRELDVIKVVGKEQPVKIYELLGKHGEIEKIYAEIVPMFSLGRNYYNKQEWDRAKECFEKVLAIRPQDGPSATLRERCLRLKETPPARHWNGIFEMATK